MLTSPDSRPDRWPVPRVRAALALAPALGLAGLAVAQSGPVEGFARYARVDRSDDTHREMFVDAATLAALRSGQALGDGATIVMRSHYRPGEVGSVFAKRREDGRWLYGSAAPGAGLPEFGSRLQCSGCHRAADAFDGTFTLPMLQRFAETGEPQRAECDRAGRTPCAASTYAAPQQVETDGKY